MSDTVLLIIALAVALAASAAALAALFRPRRDREAAALMESIRGDLAGRVEGLDRRQVELQALMLQQLTQTQSLLHERLSSQENAIREQLTGQSSTLLGQTGLLQTHMENTQGLISTLQERMGVMQQTSVRMEDMGKDMEELQRLLKAPKTRGGLGEVGLQTILSDILPAERVTYQHGFRDGTMVDAAIHLENGLLPIDAKFPMEDFHRYMEAEAEDRLKERKALQDNLKRKIDSISQKYIRPQEGTLSMAILYLPSESLYYESFVIREKDDRNLWEYACGKSILPLSPGLLVAYIRAVAQGLRSTEVAKHVQEILELLQALEKDLAGYREIHETLGTHIRNAANKYDESSRILQRYEDRLATAGRLGRENDERE